jgi:hypothetical protein
MQTKEAMSTAKTYFSAFALIVACAVIAFALWHLAGLTGVEAALTLACLLLGASQVIAHIGRDTRTDRTIAQVEDLALASAQTIREVENVKLSVTEEFRTGSTAPGAGDPCEAARRAGGVGTDRPD